MAWSRKCAAAPSIAGAASGPSGWSTNRRGVLAGGQAGVAGLTWAIAAAPAPSYAPAPPLTPPLPNTTHGAPASVASGQRVPSPVDTAGHRLHHKHPPSLPQTPPT